MSVTTRIARKVISILYPFFERLGFHVIPVYHASPIPETRDLTDGLFDSRSYCIGLEWNIAVQERYLNQIFPKYSSELQFQENSGLSLVDAAILHALIRHHKPRKIVEIGSGWSTQMAARSCVMNQEAGHECELVTIDPKPNQSVRNGFPGLSTLIEKKVETVPLDDIVDCDLLFVDSSHVVKIGGDVNYEILEIVPRLKAGALVHWHDILLPGEYWKKWVKHDHYFWAEQYLLHAFLKFNREFEVIWASRYMHLKRPEEIKAVFPGFQPDHDHITSFWVRRTN